MTTDRREIQAPAQGRWPQAGAGAPPRRHRRRAFTLLEALLALFLTILLLSGVAGFYSTTLRARQEGTKLALEVIQARAMLERMADEIRHATAYLPADGRGFEGKKDSLTLVRAGMPDRDRAYRVYEGQDTPEARPIDLARISYKLYWDNEERRDEEGVIICHGLWREEERILDPNPRYTMQASEDDKQDEMQDELQDAMDEGTEEEAAAEPESPDDVPRPEAELYAPEIKYLRFKYYDGVNWQDTWEPLKEGQAEGGAYTLPQAIWITIGRVREPPEEEELDVTQLKRIEEEREKREHHPDRFGLVVYLQVADQSLMTTRKKGVKTEKDQQMGEQTAGGQ